MKIIKRNKQDGIIKHLQYKEITIINGAILPTISRSFRSFIEKYNPKEAWLINRNFEYTITINQMKFKFLPFL